MNEEKGHPFSNTIDTLTIKFLFLVVDQSREFLCINSVNGKVIRVTFVIRRQTKEDTYTHIYIYTNVSIPLYCICLNHKTKGIP